MERKTALITGATSGIGYACALKLAKMGYHIVACGRRRERLDKLAYELKNDDVNVDLLSFDIRDYDQVVNAIQNLKALDIKIDTLINNAGLAAGLDNIENGSIDHWNRMIDTNIKGLLYITKELLPQMKLQKSGNIINIGSIAGKEVYENGNIYCGTKHMVNALNQAMRLELAPYGVRVCGIHPGAVETEFSIVRFDGNEEKAKKVYQGFDNLLAKDIAEAVEFVVSRPKHVNINDMIIMPLAQPKAGIVHKDIGI